MTIEMANRLVALRKQHGLSQEALAEKLGISRQAVSKWERAEGSPDTDNLIELSRLYGVSLDEMLFGESVAVEQDAAPEAAEDVPAAEDGIHVRSSSGKNVHIGKGGVYVLDEDGDEVHVGFDGVHIAEKHGNKVQIGGKKTVAELFPISAMATVLFVLWGILDGEYGGFGVSWIAFLLVPLYRGIVSAVRRRDARKFPWAVLAVITYLLLGFWGGLWHPGWVVFLTVPIFHGIANMFSHKQAETRGVGVSVWVDDDDDDDDDDYK